MSEGAESQSIGSTVEVPSSDKDREVVSGSKNVLKTNAYCIPNCSSMSELIGDKIDHICSFEGTLVDDSRGSSEVTNETRTVTPPLSPQDAERQKAVKTIESFLGMDGQVWQRRGRFLVWPVSLGDERETN